MALSHENRSRREPSRQEDNPQEDQLHKSEFLRREEQNQNKRQSAVLSSFAAENDEDVNQQHQFFEENRELMMETFKDKYKRFQEGQKSNSKRQKTATRSHVGSSGPMDKKKSAERKEISKHIDIVDPEVNKELERILGPEDG